MQSVEGYAAYHVMHGGLDPSGSVVIFVHGINNYNATDSAQVYDQLKDSWGGDENQAFIRFIYSNEFSKPWEFNAYMGIRSKLNVKAGKQLARLINHLQDEKIRIRKEKGWGEECDEPIYLLAYSNGSNVAYHALATYGAKVDGLIFAGASLTDPYYDVFGGTKNDISYNKLTGGAGEFNNLWSEYDIATELVDGPGSDGLPSYAANWDNVTDTRVPYVHHSSNEGKGRNPGLGPANEGYARGKKKKILWSAGSDPYYPDATTWLTRYMASEYYAGMTQQGDPSSEGHLMLSKHGTLYNNKVNLRPNEMFYYHYNYDSSNSRVYWGRGGLSPKE